jgi:hypothetical protein
VLTSGNSEVAREVFTSAVFEIDVMKRFQRSRAEPGS